jgi:hypothetical protein
MMWRWVKSNIKVWLDDFLLNAKTEDELLSILHFFFKQFHKYGLKLHASKCVLFATTVRYCGRLITKDGVRFYPKNMKARQTMCEPQNSAAGTLCRGRQLNAKRDNQLFEACGRFASSTGESARG